MPRKQRIEYAGAIYHIINRGNYRENIFTLGKSGEAFEACFFEAVQRCGWSVYAYCIMSNHYHIALKTPEPNLVDGMKWLQSTFATRFNRYRNERGHVFQGRYKSILIEPGSSLIGLINYIHLNPVRAGICNVERLKAYKLSSYSKYWNNDYPDKGFNRHEFLTLYNLPNSKEGLFSYEEQIKLCDEHDSEKRNKLYKKYCRGWYIGASESKKVLAQDLVSKSPEVDWEGQDLKQLNEEKWELIVVSKMKAMNKTDFDIVNNLKSAGWKIEIAKTLRRDTTASNIWITNRLRMGHPNYVSKLIYT